MWFGNPSGHNGEEIDRLSIGVEGTASLLSSIATLTFIRGVPPGGYTKGLPAHLSSSQHTASPAFGCVDNDLRRSSQWQNDRHVFLYTFDMIELDGQDLRHEQIEARKTELAKLLRNLTSALRSRRRRLVHSHGER